MRRRALVRLSQFFVAGSTLLPWMSAADATDLALDRTFTQTVRPFLASYCAGCHGTAAPAAQFDIRPYTNIAAVVSDLGHWNLLLARRLSNSEYNYTIRDLTGVDMQPTREFPVDPANTAGFDNSGESLTMSPALLNKYLQAARDVANRMVLSPDSIDFATHPMLVETDRDRYAIQRIVSFYERQPTDYVDYFEVAWRFKHRRELGKSGASLA